MLVATLLFIGALEAGGRWFGCVISVGTVDALYVCSVVGFDVHHFTAIVLVLGAAWVLIRGFKRDLHGG